MKDDYVHKGLRKQLVEDIRKKGIKDNRVLNALEEIPRHLFIDTAFLKHAYEDKALQIGEGQTISQPYTVAYQTELLQIEQTHRILEVGTGSGYQASVLSKLCDRVYTIERFQVLSKKARIRLNKLGCKNISYFFGDGFEGIPAFAPFDGIIVTAAAPSIPEKLISQLKIGGRMVIPYGTGATQRMLRLSKDENGEIIQEEFENFAFVPMLKGKIAVK